jgi:hypothetical protein
MRSRRTVPHKRTEEGRLAERAERAVELSRELIRESREVMERVDRVLAETARRLTNGMRGSR